MGSVTLKRKRPKRKVRPHIKTGKRTAFVGLRLTESEKRILEDAAAERGLSTSDYIRDHFIHIKGDQSGRVKAPADD